MNQAGSDNGAPKFLDNYLAHLERKDSREGATKWVLLAAMAAVAWQLSSIQNTSLSFVMSLLGVCLVLYYLAERTSELLEANDDEHKEVRFLSRKMTRPAEAKYGVFLCLRYALTALIFFLFFETPEKADRLLVVVPVALVALAHGALLIEMQKEYNIKKPQVFGPSFKVFFGLIFIAPVVTGLYLIFLETQIFSKAIEKSNIGSLQAAGLCFVLIFLVEKYVRTLRVDSEVTAVRKIWRRHGVGEIADDEAMRQLKIIVAGASLSEVTSDDVNAFSVVNQRIENLISKASQELESFKVGLSGYDQITKAAFLNSLEKRKGDINAGVSALKASRDEIVVKLRKLLSDDKLSDQSSQTLKNELDERCEKCSSESAKLTQAIDAVSESAPSVIP